LIVAVWLGSTGRPIRQPESEREGFGLARNCEYAQDNVLASASAT
jgi:hypothetical protein